MTSLTSQLLDQDPSEALAASEGTPQPASAGEGEGEQVTPANEAEGDALAAAKVAEKLAHDLGDQMEKVASSGQQVPNEAVEMVVTLRKLAHYVPELIQVIHARTKYAEYCLEQAASGATREEAFKLASDMVADGMLEVPEGQTIADLADEIYNDEAGLRTIKKAVDMVASGRLTRIGQVEPTEKNTNETGPIGDSEAEWLGRHDWLLSP